MEFYESIVCEFTDIAGFDVEIYLHNAKGIDPIYGESVKSELDGPYKTKLLMEPFKEPYLINVLGFMGDQKVEYAEMPKAM
jgi:hypothetical protein